MISRSKKSSKEKIRDMNCMKAKEYLDGNGIEYKKHYQGLLVNKQYVFSVKSFKWRHVSDYSTWEESKGIEDFIEQTKIHKESTSRENEERRREVRKYFESKGIDVTDYRKVFLLNDKYLFSPTTFKFISKGSGGTWLNTNSLDDFYNTYFCPTVRSIGTIEERTKFAMEYFCKLGINVNLQDNGIIDINGAFFYNPSENTWRNANSEKPYLCKNAEDLYLRFLSQEQNREALFGNKNDEVVDNNITNVSHDIDKGLTLITFSDIVNNQNSTEGKQMVTARTVAKVKNKANIKKEHDAKIKLVEYAKKEVLKLLEPYKNTSIVNADGSYLTTMVMTPAIAKILIKTNPKSIELHGLINRSLSSRRVKEYSESMKSGKWYFNSSTIIISKDGCFLDGQHRLMACIKGDVKFPTAILFNIDKNIMPTIDIGHSRNDNDLFKMYGVKNPTKMTSIVKTAIRLQQESSTDNPQSKFNTRTNIRADMLKDETYDEYLKRLNLHDQGNGSLYDFYEYAIKTRKEHTDMGVITPIKITPIAFFIANQFGKEFGEGFIRKIYTQLGRKAGDPLSVYESFIINKKNRGMTTSEHGYDVCALIGSWNNFVLGRVIKKFSGGTKILGGELIFDIPEHITLYVDGDHILQRKIGKIKNVTTK